MKQTLKVTFEVTIGYTEMWEDAGEAELGWLVEERIDEAFGSVTEELDEHQVHSATVTDLQVTVKSTEQGEPRLLYVNAYSVERCYGGPEEGGWWYDAGTPIASLTTQDKEEVAALEEQLTERHGWTSLHNRYSVMGGDDFVVRVESEPARPYPTTRPHYE